MQTQSLGVSAALTESVSVSVRGGEALLDVIVKAGSEASGAKVSLGETISMAPMAPNPDNLCFSPPS